MKNKYPISDEFKRFAKFTPSLNASYLAMARMIMHPPKFLWEDPELQVERRKISGYNGAEIEVLVMSPCNLPDNAPCLVYFHGGGFVLEAAGCHYALAMKYAKEGGCKVIFVQYRLAPAVVFPVPQEDCYSALCWAYEHAGELGIDIHRMAVGGDSAGAQLAAVVSLLVRERNHPVDLCFQMLIYPFLDMRNNSESAKRFTDTPMWNSRLSAEAREIFNPGNGCADKIVSSPAEAESLADLPPAYIETAEFDCLHDDGILYANRLEEAGVEAELYETIGTMHGYDIVLEAPITREAVSRRIHFLKRVFNK